MSDIQRYWYLAGPMSGIPQMNFPLFEKAAEELRAERFVIVSPAEIDSPEVRAASLASDTGSIDDIPESWNVLIARDIEIVTSDKCVGVIVLPGWMASTGARLEVFAACSLGKQIRKYDPDTVKRPHEVPDPLGAIHSAMLSSHHAEAVPYA